MQTTESVRVIIILSLFAGIVVRTGFRCVKCAPSAGEHWQRMRSRLIIIIQFSETLTVLRVKLNIYILHSADVPILPLK